MDGTVFSKAFYELSARNQICYFSFCIGNRTKHKKVEHFFLFDQFEGTVCLFPMEGLREY